jgi:hypothetical protein
MRRTFLVLVASIAFLAAGCGTSSDDFHDSLQVNDAASGASSGSGIPFNPVLNAGVGDSATPFLQSDSSSLSPATTTNDPQTCADAAQARSYVGCDYWPTVVANNVWKIFDFAVVVANAGATAANVTLTGPMNTNQTATVQPGRLAKIYLPWVPALKGADANNCGEAPPLTSSVLAVGGAFHLVSSVPVTVYQFNALEYQGVGGPPGKNWSSCPGFTVCTDPQIDTAVGCFSFSNDASLLLPSTAMTGNYRVAGHEGVAFLNDPTPGMTQSNGGYMAITATADATTVAVVVSSTGQIAAGAGVAATSTGSTLTLTLNAGDVAELLGPGGSDLSGSVVRASAPVQVLTGHPCYENPPESPACDHMEESVFPAETLGKDYLVTRPAGPTGDAVGQEVRLYGNFDNTNLTYNPSAPAGCPATLNAGQVVECGTGGACPATIDVTKPYPSCGITNQDFEVIGDQPFAVDTFTLGATLIDPNMIEGDPAQSAVVAVEQFRSKYVFLAPDDYTANFVEIVARPAATMTMDNQTVLAIGQPIGSTQYSAYRVNLGLGQAGAHVLVASEPVGLQVEGYGDYTSYRYPGGLNLARIAPPPPR